MSRESYIEGTCRDWCRDQRWLLLKLWPIMAGIPDRILLRHGGRVDFVEFKAPGKKLEPAQRFWRDTLTRLGFRVHRVDSVKQFKQLFGGCNEPTEGV